MVVDGEDLSDSGIEKAGDDASSTTDIVPNSPRVPPDGNNLMAQPFAIAFISIFQGPTMTTYKLINCVPTTNNITNNFPSTFTQKTSANHSRNTESTITSIFTT